MGYPPNGLSSTLDTCPEWIKKGCGNDEYHCEEKNAVFPADKCPDELPDLSKHTNFAAEFLREHKDIYAKLKDVKTKSDVPLAKCIKTGMDNPGHPMIKTCGLVAGDEDSFETFKEIFDPVISARHEGYPADAKHITDLDWNKLSKTEIDPKKKYVLTSRVRTGRSVRGIRLPPSCTFEERRELERVIVKGLKNLGDCDSEFGKICLKGQYFPLYGSESYDGAMDKEKEEDLRSRGNLFQEPDSTLLLSSGCGRHWPDARGIFHNEAKDFFVWVNEEDHMRIISMEKGDNIKKIFVRFATACNEVQKILKAEGYDFMHNDHLGYVLTCPSNLGTGLRAGAMMKIPLISNRKDFKNLLFKMGLQGRGTGGVDTIATDTWDISNKDRLGKSEVELVNIFIEGSAQLLKWEELLENGEKDKVEAEVAERMK